ncbi:hypothetical protein [Acinetobacter sp. ANC 4173]|uniref:hypothetical protein n=1 Tax=Acinetobacter sp. ANC 4173 TaxID=2529837 RepID=UPI001040C52D|nr:hypothetical protein [Acinetobacter sp. ANC 4173]TCB81664.1 hypothetical protein E0H94_03860 [Acinetobacter sp. ANC 4173]
MNQPEKIDLDIDTLKDSAIYNIKQLKKRGYSFPQFNSLMQQAGLSSSTGFDSICAKVRKFESGDIERTITQILRVSEAELYKHTTLASKRIYIFNLAEDKLLEIKENFDNNGYICEDLDEGYTTIFNYEVTLNTPRQMSLMVEPSDSLSLYYIKDVRSYFEKASVPNLIENIENTDETSQVIDVVKIVRHTVCVFDFVAIDLKNSCLVLGLDLDSQFTNAEMNKAYGQLKDLFQSLFGSEHFTPQNLLPCVQKMEDEELGNVVKHYFATEDGAFNYTAGSSTLRKDARKDEFFEKGMKELDADFYGVSKRYPFGNDNPIITIKMGLGEYKKSAFSPIKLAILDHVTQFENFQACVDKIMEHLKSD